MTDLIGEHNRVILTNSDTVENLTDVNDGVINKTYIIEPIRTGDGDVNFQETIKHAYLHPFPPYTFGGIDFPDRDGITTIRIKVKDADKRGKVDVYKNLDVWLEKNLNSRDMWKEIMSDGIEFGGKRFYPKRLDYRDNENCIIYHSIPLEEGQWRVAQKLMHAAEKHFGTNYKAKWKVMA